MPWTSHSTSSSTLLPSARRKRSTPVVVTCLPAGGMPIRSPLWVPRRVKRSKTLSPYQLLARVPEQGPDSPVVGVGPSFDGPPVCDTGDENPRRAYLFACRWNAHEVALVGATKRLANHDSVSFSDQVLNREA